MKQQDKRSSGVHVGGASILMIFAVLCLTVFSVLSFVTAHQEWKLAQKSAQVMQQYYEADWQCETYYEEINKMLQMSDSVEQLAEKCDLLAKEYDINMELTRQEGQYAITYAVPMDENQKLQVQLIADDAGVLQIKQWKVLAIRQLVYEDRISVWDGE